MIARGIMLGADQPVILHMLDIPFAAEALNGVKMELIDAAFPLLKGSFSIRTCVHVCLNTFFFFLNICKVREITSIWACFIRCCCYNWCRWGMYWSQRCCYGWWFPEERRNGEEGCHVQERFHLQVSSRCLGEARRTKLQGDGIYLPLFIKKNQFLWLMSLHLVFVVHWSVTHAS